MKRVIYGLHDPRILPVEVRYVGYTSKGAEQRLAEHVQEARLKSTNVHRLNWLRSLAKDGVMPQAVVLEQVNAENWKAKEAFWINHFGRKNLVNSTNGGEGLVNPSQAVRDRIAAKVSKIKLGNQIRKGVPHREEDKVKISQGLKTSEKFKASNLRRKGVSTWDKQSEDQKQITRAKISAARTGVSQGPFSEQARKNMSLAHIGLKQSEETKQKKSENIKNSEKFQAAMAARVGVQMTDDIKAKMKAARQGTKAINNGLVCKVIKSTDALPKGWVYGRLPNKRKTDCSLEPLQSRSAVAPFLN